MRTSQIKSFKSNFIAIGWHFSALFVINSLLIGLDCNKQLRHYCTRAYYKEYAFFSLAKIYLNLLKSRFSRELYLFITIAKDTKLKTRENETVALSSAEASLYCGDALVLCCGEAGEKEKESARGTMGRGKRALSIFVDY